jgi:alpha-tubulin suppressor-like RCC1 family protein
MGFFVNVAAVAAGGAHSCALRSTGRVHCWGNNGFGQLSDGTRSSTNAERGVVGIVNAVSLSSTRDHNCALLGDVLCWGRNDFGQVDGTLGSDRLVPTPVTLAAGDAVAVTTGFQHTCILTPAGGVRCWWRNDEGQFGNNTTVDSLAPVTVRRQIVTTTSAVTDAVGLVSDAAHNCALRVTGQPVCLGRNPEGQLGEARAFGGWPPWGPSRSPRTSRAKRIFPARTGSPR